MVFGIDNAFTNPDTNVKSAFTKHGIKLTESAMQITKEENSKGDWSDLRSHALTYCKEYIAHPTNTERMNLFEIAQYITLKLSLY
jgi:hypothetical protein